MQIANIYVQASNYSPCTLVPFFVKNPSVELDSEEVMSCAEIQNQNSDECHNIK